MEEITKIGYYWRNKDFYLREAPQLASVLREMKDGLDVFMSKMEALTVTAKIKDYFGAESKEQKKFIAQYERQQQVEEDLFVRPPRTKLLGLAENFYDEIKFLDKDGEQPSSFSGSGRKNGGKSREERSDVR
ncbi:unnamed protein product [Cochlearia groenlandica]